MNKKIKGKTKREHETISLQARFISLCMGVYACAILSPIDSNRSWAHHASEVTRDLIAFEFAEWILMVGTSERWKCPRVHFVVVSDFLFLFFT